MSRANGLVAHEGIFANLLDGESLSEQVEHFVGINIANLGMASVKLGYSLDELVLPLREVSFFLHALVERFVVASLHRPVQCPPHASISETL